MMNLENKGHGRVVAMSLVAVVFGGIAILWSWNTIAVDLFAQPAMEFRHAVAAELMLIAGGSLVGLPSLFSRFKKG